MNIDTGHIRCNFTITDPCRFPRVHGSFVTIFDCFLSCTVQSLITEFQKSSCRLRFCHLEIWENKCLCIPERMSFISFSTKCLCTNTNPVIFPAYHDLKMIKCKTHRYLCIIFFTINLNILFLPDFLPDFFTFFQKSFIAFFFCFF